MSSDLPYPNAQASPQFAKIEDAILKRWQEHKISERSVANRWKLKDGRSNEYVLYDGPPYTNDMPHYGHILTGLITDLIHRYKTMQGYHVKRISGWHRDVLPAALPVDGELAGSGANDLSQYDTGKFNTAREAAVLRYTREWKSYTTRQGCWSSSEDPYLTVDRSYIESVMWAFRQLWGKGLVYEKYRVVPYSWAAQMPLSPFEIRLHNSYRDCSASTLTVGFELQAENITSKPVRLLAWTTAPWTLPANLALCVNPEFDYVLLERSGEQIILAENARDRYVSELDGYEVVKTLKGADLVALRYTPLFPYFAGTENAFQVISGEFVDAHSGTGIVPIAPGFGESDMDVAQKFAIPVVVPVDDAGRFTAEVPDYVGLHVILEGNERISQDLKARHRTVWQHGQILHRYPHCWRTGQPLLYKAIRSWYLEVSKIRGRMVELNQGINWVPGHVKEGSIANGLANARDWNISRNRTEGCPIPVWKSDDDQYPRIDVYGSIEELERDFGVKVTDLHRSALDHLVRPNPDDPSGQSMMRRVPEVLDGWFASGCMPFAQQHYPFENQQHFEENFPGDLAVGHIPQLRGWFHALMAISTALFDRAPFQSCICPGALLDENRQKLSTGQNNNHPDPADLFNTWGADALRCYLLGSSLPAGGHLLMKRDARIIQQSMRSVLIRLWSAYSFFARYADVDQVKPQLRTDSKHPLDRYLLGKTSELVQTIGRNLDKLDIQGAYQCMHTYADTLNNWYIRHRRGAFWAETRTEDKQAAVSTLYTALLYATKSLAPLLPFVCEAIYTALTGEESVHLADWPHHAELPVDQAVMEGVRMVREIYAMGFKVRSLNALELAFSRPLQKLVVVHPRIDVLTPYIDLLKDVLNVVQVELCDSPGAYGKRTIRLNPELGAKYGARFSDMQRALQQGSWRLNTFGMLELAGTTLDATEFEYRARPHVHDWSCLSFDSERGLVMLDLEHHPELDAQFWLREVKSNIRQARKRLGLKSTDRATVKADLGHVGPALAPFLPHISAHTLLHDIGSAGEELTGENVLHTKIGFYYGVVLQIERAD